MVDAMWTHGVRESNGGQVVRIRLPGRYGKKMRALTVGVVGDERESGDRSKTGSWRIIESSVWIVL